VTDDSFAYVVDFLHERGYRVRDYSEMAKTESLWVQVPPLRGFDKLSKSSLIKLAYNIAVKEVYGRENQLIQGSSRESS